MKKNILPEHATHVAASFSRRRFLSYTSTGLLGCSNLLATALIAQPAYAQTTAQVATSPSTYIPPIVQLFYRVSSILCAKPDLDRTLSTVALEILEENVTDLGLKLQQISKLQDDPEQFALFMSGQYPSPQDRQNEDENGEQDRPTELDQVEQQHVYEALRELAQQILQAFYVGATGKGASARLISYEQALMFIPTRNVTVIPSYTRAGYNYWVTPPVATQNPQ